MRWEDGAITQSVDRRQGELLEINVNPKLGILTLIEESS